MKIAFYTTSFFPYLCGVTTAIWSLCRGLSKQGHEVVICIPKAKSPILARVREEGIKIVFLPAFQQRIYKDKDRKAGVPSAKSFLQIKKINPDIIHFHTPDLVGLEAILTARILKKPLIGSFHTYFMSPEYQRILRLGKTGEDLIEKILWKYNNSVYNRCDLVITPSVYAKWDLQKNGLKKPVEIVSYPIDLSSLTKTSASKKARLKKRFNLNNKTVLYVGRLSREKSLDLLILAFNLVVRQLRLAKLLLVGDGPAKGELKELVLALGLEKNIIFAGKMDYAELFESGVYELATLFATASTSEVQPMSILEAMAFGLPIVGVKARGVPEMIRGNGIICPPGNIRKMSKAIIKILKDQSLHTRLAKKSRELIEKEHAIDKVTRRLEEVYLKVKR
ncbi:MAG TPA: glycosyltransferase [Candidatus Bathyarchaeia archaeon]|nr:glycosyltransferase [Candidatus Bathyarchaeia archaeon]